MTGRRAERPVDIILNAAIEASLDLDDWRKADWSNSDRNEQWIHSYLAVRVNDYARRKVKDCQGVFVTLESKVSWLDAHCSSLPRRGRPSLTPGQRFDLAVWSGECVEGLVEVKNAPRTKDGAFEDDLTKLRKALRRWGPECSGSLRWGVFLFSAIGRRGGNRVPKLAVEEELERRLAACGIANGIGTSLSAWPVQLQTWTNVALDGGQFRSQDDAMLLRSLSP